MDITMDETNLNDVCAFCYKIVEESIHLGINNRTQTVPRFYTFLERICEKRLNVSGSSAQFLATCEACVSIMDSCNELYHQVQCLQLQMEWRLDKLKNVMKLADKIPSRVKAFRERYDIPSEMLSFETLHGEEYKQLLDMRNVIQSQLTEYLSNVFPHVSLKTLTTPKSNHYTRNNSIEQMELKLRRSQLQEPRLQLNNNPYFALQWLKTVIGLAMCCLPIVRYHNTPEHFVATLESSPEIVGVSDVVSEPMPEFTVSVNCTSPGVTVKEHCPEPISPPSPPSSGQFDDVFSDSPDPIISQMVECIMKKDSGEQMIDNDESIPSKIMALQSQVTVVTQNMDMEDDSFTSPNQPCSSSDTKIICITEPEQLYTQNKSPEQSLMRTTKILAHQTCENLQVDESELENEIPSTRRQLRSKFKCKNCCLTFSTLIRLNIHSRSCNITNDFNESEDEKNSKEEVEAAISDNDSNYDDMSPQASENERKEECPFEEDSDSDFSNEDLNEDECDIKPNTINKVKVTKTRSRRVTDSWSLEECLEVYKKTNGQTPLCEKSVLTLKLTATDIQLKAGFESLETCKYPECHSGLFSMKELEYHESLHGHFKCYFCEFSSNFATKVVSHESEHNSNMENGLCPRCPGVKVDAVNYNKHFVEHHLEKGIKYRCTKCPVCSMSYPKTDQVPLVHFVNEHDVSRLNDPEKVFSCNEDNCSAYFLTVKQLIYHYKVVHSKPKRFRHGKLVDCLIECDVCSLKFPSVSILKVHKHKKHATNKDPGLTVITFDGLTINDIYNSQNKNVPCPVKSCSRTFCTEEDRDAHSKHHGTFQCNFCSVKKTFAPDLAVHELEHADSVNIAPSLIPRAEFKCSRCTFSSCFQQRYIDHHIAEHLQLSPDEVTITCPICQQTFATTTGRNLYLKKYLLEHFVTHHDKSELKDNASLFNCALCPAYFLTEAQLHVHNNRVHPEQTSLGMDLICVDCHLQFRFRDRAFLLHHRTKNHHNNDESGYEFICETEKCNKRFEYKCDLERHHLWHSLGRLNSKKRQGRVRQKRKHQELVCKQCVKTFPSNSRLEEHMLSHSEPESWEFSCDICLKKCLTIKDLTRHKETHPNTSHYLLSGSLEECLEKYKNTNGKTPLSQKNIETLKLSGADIRLKYPEFLLESCDQSGCEPGLYSSADLEYHRLLHGQFQCSFCEYSSTFAINIIQHEIEHSSNLENKLCPRCPEVKVNILDYKRHFVELHLETSVMYRCAHCPVCSKTFSKSVQVPLLHFVNEHDVSRLNDPEKVFSCNEDSCSAYFLTAKQLIAHSKEVHNKTKALVNRHKVVDLLFACDICPRKFVCPSKLNLHKKKNHRQPFQPNSEETDFISAYEKFPCLTASCQRKFLTKEAREAHCLLHDCFKCEFCPVKKYFGPDLAIHEMRLHSKRILSLAGEDTFNCSRCEFSSIRQEECIRHHLETHLNLSPDTFTIPCHICQQPFYETLGSNRTRVKHALVCHFRTCHDKTGIVDPAALCNCVYCPAYFLTLTQLHLHNQRMHPEHLPSLSLSCTDCSKPFRTRSLLLSHRSSVHHNHNESGFQFICKLDNCNKRFEYECDLEHHIAWHSRFTPKSCPECGKVLMTQHAYDLHVKSHHHQGHVCDQCGKKFRIKAQLTVHMAYHAGPDSWQFMCDICSRKCATKLKLAEHKKVHSKIKSYVCDTCGATYAHRHNWRHHMIKVHGVPESAVFTRKHTKPLNMTSRKGKKDQQNVSSKRKKRC